MEGQSAAFYVDDSVALKEDPFVIGIVERTFGDVDSHAPSPQQDYYDKIERHDGVSKTAFAKFLKNGVPPKGTVLIAWHLQFKTELVPENVIKLLDRSFFVGDVVKRGPRDSLSGTVVATDAICTLLPVQVYADMPLNELSKDTRDRMMVRDIPVRELQHSHEFREGCLVLYDDWVGRVDEVHDEVSVRLNNGSVVAVENPTELVSEDPLFERFSIGDVVTTKKGNLRRGQWTFGAFNANIAPTGTVVKIRTISVVVTWLCRRLGASPPTSAIPGSYPDGPPGELDLDILESGNVQVYNSGAHLVNMPQGFSSSDIAVGDKVRFRDLMGACVKYDGSRRTVDGEPQGKVNRLQRTDTLGFDLNVFLVTRTKTEVKVLWQDLSISEDSSTSLIPDPNIHDESELWPGEIICTESAEKSEQTSEKSWAFEPSQVGVVQSVRSVDRIARVKWFPDASVQFVNDDLLPGSYTGDVSNEVEEETSLYDVITTRALNRRRGDFVMLHPGAIKKTIMPTAGSKSGTGELTEASEPPRGTGVDWFGEIVDLGLDGLLTVRLGAFDPIQDVKVQSECVTLAYSNDVHDDYYEATSETNDGLEDVSETSEGYRDIWIEYDGERIDEDNDDEAWSTEEEQSSEEDSDSDVPMPDQPALETSKTTPETMPESKVQSSSGRPESEQVQAHSTYDFSTKDGAPPQFLILESSPPLTHHYVNNPVEASAQRMRRIQKEHKILQSSLPEGIYVRTWESRLDLLRVLIVGPVDTPYEFAPFVIDFHLGSSYPNSPPNAFFHSWTNNHGPVNPNLYEDGKICLSLLGTWHADEKNENWSPSKSTLLQILVSLLGLVLVKEPYYSEYRV